MASVASHPKTSFSLVHMEKSWNIASNLSTFDNIEAYSYASNQNRIMKCKRKPVGRVFRRVKDCVMPCKNQPSSLATERAEKKFHHTLVSLKRIKNIAERRATHLLPGIGEQIVCRYWRGCGSFNHVFDGVCGEEQTEQLGNNEAHPRMRIQDQLLHVTCTKTNV